MKNKSISLVILTLWALLTAALWFGPRQSVSDSERRPLAQMPEITVDAVLNGKFMSDFEDFTLDQFPLRDTFRTVKSLFHQYILGQSDNNGIYLHSGYAAKQEYPLNPVSISHISRILNRICRQHLSDSRVFMAIVPDKGQYLAEESGHLSLPFGKLNTMLLDVMPQVTPIDLYDTLDYTDYYRTDTHWKQETLLPAASKLAEILGIPAPNAEDYTAVSAEKPFYGVYYGQAALPMEPDTLTWLESDILNNCTVYDHETGETTDIYNLEKLESKDLYDVFLSGAKPLLTIQNPAAETEKELIVFRDSFGSSMIPLLVHGYSTITVVDIRYLSSTLLPQFIDFHGQDVLFLYSTLVLNSSDTIR